MNNNENIIWRYMNADVFLLQLILKKIFFSNILTYPDKTEGDPKENSLFNTQCPGGKHWRQMKKTKIENDKKIENMKISCYASCWSIDTEENNTLWSCYTNSVKGIVIKSSVDQFLRSTQPNPFAIESKTITYYPSKMETWEKTYKNRVFSKFHPFNSENEYRFLIRSEKNDPNPILIETDFNELITELHLSPWMPIKLRESFKDVVLMIEPKFQDKIKDSEISIRDVNTTKQ